MGSFSWNKQFKKIELNDKFTNEEIKIFSEFILNFYKYGLSYASEIISETKKIDSIMENSKIKLDN